MAGSRVETGEEGEGGGGGAPVARNRSDLVAAKAPGEGGTEEAVGGGGGREEEVGVGRTHLALACLEVGLALLAAAEANGDVRVVGAEAGGGSEGGGLSLVDESDGVDGEGVVPGGFADEGEVGEGEGAVVPVDAVLLGEEVGDGAGSGSALEVFEEVEFDASPLR